MTEDYGLDIQDFIKVVNEVSEYIVVDIRDEDLAEQEGIFEQSFQIEEYELPSDVSAIPSYFKNVTVVIIADDPLIAKKWVHTYRNQDENITGIYYLNGTAPEVFLVAPELKEQ